MSAPLLRMNDVSVVRGRDVLLDRVSLEVPAGAAHALVGPNGAGKTTLLRSILGQVPFSGSIEIAWRREGRLAYVPQRHELDASLPLVLEEFLGLCWQRRPVVAGLSGSARRGLEETLDRLGLRRILRHPFAQLSGGERQRALLAQALYPRPELLLLDEAAAGLDAEAEDTVVKILEECRREGTTLLFVSHDPRHLERLAGSATLLDRRIVVSGEVSTVLDQAYPTARSQGVVGA